MVNNVLHIMCIISQKVKDMFLCLLENHFEFIFYFSFFRIHRLYISYTFYTTLHT